MTSACDGPHCRECRRVDAVNWYDVKGFMVIAGTYDMAVKMMSDMNFLSALMNFPKEQINDETVSH
jgi:hypothetical protein